MQWLQGNDTKNKLVLLGVEKLHRIFGVFALYLLIELTLKRVF